VAGFAADACRSPYLTWSATFIVGASVDPQHQLIELLHRNEFDLVRQRKHRVYRNPDGLVFVTASTPSDRRASQNALSTLKRILGRSIPQAQSLPVPAVAPTSPPMPAPAAEPMPAAGPVVETEFADSFMSDQEWVAWKRRYWRDEKLWAKNERFLSMISKYVNRASVLMQTREDCAQPETNQAIKTLLRDARYKSKVLLYNWTFFSQGIAIGQGEGMPILWASNGHIGISAFLLANVYTQHGPSRVAKLRLDWDGMPMLFEMPENARTESPDLSG
jgi:hypothetical protein